VIPDSKPFMTFDEAGVCAACRSHERKNRADAQIDWRARAGTFERLVEEVRSRQSPLYDVLVPVSGGKDSLAQVHRLRGRGLRVLAVNVDYGIKTAVGWHNLNRVPEMGASLVIFRPELELHKRLIRIGLEDYGDPDLLSHTLLYAWPLHAALQFGIPLVLLGENSAFEYGGDADIAAATQVSRAWFSRYVANSGRDARFVSREHGIPMAMLRLYDFPDAIEQSATRAVFMSYYYHWDSETHLGIARQYGFRTLDGPGEGTYRTYVGIDEKINRVHQYLKVLKFGYGRATDHACEDIRNGRLSREAAKELVRRHDLEPLSDAYVDEFAAFVEMTREAVLAAFERHRNLAVWKKQPSGRWHVPGHLEDDAVEL
jgi:N-acetyl sugar amidotransferase